MNSIFIGRGQSTIDVYLPHVLWFRINFNDVWGVRTRNTMASEDETLHKTTLTCCLNQQLIDKINNQPIRHRFSIWNQLKFTFKSWHNIPNEFNNWERTEEDVTLYSFPWNVCGAKVIWPSNFLNFLFCSLTNLVCTLFTSYLIFCHPLCTQDAIFYNAQVDKFWNKRPS